MIKHFIIGQLLIFLTLPLFGQVSVTHNPSWVEEIVFEEKIVKEDDYSGGQAYLLVDRQFNLETEERFLHYSYKILSEAGIQNGAVIEVSFDPTYERLSFISIDLIRNNERSSHLVPGNFQIIQKEANAERFIYDGEKTAILHLSDVRVGDIIDYKFLVKGRNPVFDGLFFTSYYFNYQDPIGRIHMRIKAPPHKKLNIKHFETEINPAVKSENGEVYTWDVRNTQGLLYDSYVPSWYDPYAQVQISEFKHWAQVVGWALPLYTASRQDLSAVKAKALSIINEHEKKEDQILAALNFVQDEVRYLGFESGLNGFAPHAPSKVIQQRFGDCKDKSFLLAKLLKAMDVEAYPALVHSEKGKTLPDMLPSPGVFDHCIVKVVFNDEILWYDPTISNQGGAYNTTYFPDYKHALVIKEGTNDIEVIKPYSDSRIESRETFIVKDFEQPTRLNVITRYKGKEADYQRSYYLNNSLAQIQKGYLAYYAEFFPKITLAKDVVYEDEQGVNMFTVREAYEIEEFWTALDGTNDQTIKSEVYPQLVNEFLIDPGQASRKSPLYLSYPKEIDQIIEFELPEPWDVENSTNKIIGPGLVYTSFLSNIDKKLILNYTLKTEKDHLEPTELAEYKKAISQIKPDLGFILTYNKALATAVGDSNINWLVVVVALCVLSICIFIARKIYFDYDPFSPLKRIAYDGIGGWLILVGFGILISPFSILFATLSQGYFDKSAWANITLISSSNYNPALAAFFVVELALNIALFIFSCLVAILFIKRRSSFPRLAIIFYLSHFVYMVLDGMIYLSLDAFSGMDQTAFYNQIGRSFISLAIWVPYFIRSERVKETFVHTYRDYPEEENISSIKNEVVEIG